jgi:hypothetical protein
MATKQIVPLNSAKILHLYNSDNVEYYVGLGYFLPINQDIYGLCSPYILLQKYYISNTLKTQGLTGDWFDDNGNKYSFSSSGVVITTPSGTTKTIELPNPESDKTAILYFTYSEADGFCIVVGKNAIPYDYSSQYGTYQTAQRTANDYDYAYELCDTISATNRDTYGWGTVLIVPDYNNITPNTPVRSAMCLWTNKGNYSVTSDKDSFNYQSIDPINFNGFNSPLVDSPDDPYQPGGTTTPGGGQGSFDRSSDPIDVPGLPLLSAIDTGFISLWRPSSTELINLYNYMWSNAFDLESFKKIFANPIDAIMGFGIIPLNPVTGAARSLKIGNIDTGVNVTPVTEQYYQVDCGTLYLDNFFDTYLEFEPYSTLEIFLPFCGCMQLSADDFYRRKKEYPGGGKINVKYNVDILSGACVAFISCYDANGKTTMTYEFNGNLLTQIPITGNDFSGLYNAVLGIAGNVISGVAHAATGNAAGILGDVVNAAHNVASAKPSINRSGTIGGSYGLLANRKPFLIRNIPREAAAWAQNTFQGYPSHITTVIRSINGYTEFEKVYTDNIPASDNELKEIVQILETGVIL